MKYQIARACCTHSSYAIFSNCIIFLGGLNVFINTSIATNVFPKPWKHSIIMPIHELGDVKEQTNFSPIDLLPILSKILEKVNSTQLTYLENNNFLREGQYAYGNNSSTQQELVNVTEQIYKSIDKS